MHSTNNPIDEANEKDHGINQPDDLDLSTAKWGHVSPVSWASFMPIFSSLHPCILDFGSGTGQTDDGHQHLIPHPMDCEEPLCLVIRFVMVWC